VVDQRLVVELDGHEFHRTRAAFERDRIRDAALQLAGFRVLRITYRRLEQEPAEVIATVRALLGCSIATPA
jgi:very-short-patch-repair endonuclease